MRTLWQKVMSLFLGKPAKQKVTYDGDSAAYWQTRYEHGGNSGSGSYGRLAQFKASVLNEFMEKNGIRTVVELGCGDGNQLSLLKCPRYLGLDIAKAVVEECQKKFGGAVGKSFVEFDSLRERVREELRADAALSLDVIYHLVEDDVFNAYMTALFGIGKQFVVIYSSNSDKRVATAPHVRHRRFSDWVEANQPDWRMESEIRNPFPFDPDDSTNTSFADFYIYRRREGVAEAACGGERSLPSEQQS